MSYEKQYFADGQTLTAAQLNHMEAGIAAAAGVKGDKGEKGDPGEGLTANAKQLILILFEKAAYGNAEMQSVLSALKTEWGLSDSGSGTTVPVQSVSLSAAELTLNEGESKTLTVTVLPENATSVISFSLSPGGVADLGETTKLAPNVYRHTVKALKAGTCTAKASAGGKSAQCVVTVTAKDQPQEPATDGYGTLLYKLPAATRLDGNGYLDTKVKLFANGAAADWSVIAAYTGPVTCAQGLPRNLFCCCNDGGQGLLCRQGSEQESWMVAGGRGAFVFNDSCFSYSGKTLNEILREDGQVNIVAVTKAGNNYAFYLNGVQAWNSPLEYGFSAAIPEDLSLIFGARYTVDGSSVEYKTAFTLNDARVYNAALEKDAVAAISEALMGGA